MTAKQSPTEFLSALEAHLQTEVKPKAAQIDANTADLNAAMTELNQQFLRHIWFDSKVEDMNPALLADLALEKMAEVSGALAFTAAQHMGACRRVALSPNKELAARIAQDVAAGHMTLGVGTTHMKPGPCVVNAAPTETGFVINGKVPWASGYEVFSHLFVAARVGQHGVLVALVPFASANSEAGGSMTVGDRFDLTVMNGSNTVSIDFENFAVAEADVLLAIPDSDQPHGPMPPPFYVFPVGCARAALNQAEEANKKYQNEAIAGAITELRSDLEAAAKEAREVYGLRDVMEIIKTSIAARAKIDALIMRSINVALPLVGGRANVVGDEMGRLVREASVYSTSLLAEPIVQAKVAAVSR